jgi:hypothetical protein
MVKTKKPLSIPILKSKLKTTKIKTIQKKRDYYKKYIRRKNKIPTKKKLLYAGLGALATVGTLFALKKIVKNYLDKKDSNKSRITTPRISFKKFNYDTAPTTPRFSSKKFNYKTVPTTPRSSSKKFNYETAPTTPRSSSKKFNYETTLTTPRTSSKKSNYETAPTTPRTSYNKSNYETTLTTPRTSSKKSNYETTLRTPRTSSKKSNYETEPTTSRTSSKKFNYETAPTTPRTSSKKVNYETAPTTPRTSSKKVNYETAPTTPRTSIKNDYEKGEKKEIESIKYRNSYIKPIITKYPSYSNKSARIYLKSMLEAEGISDKNLCDAYIKLGYDLNSKCGDNKECKINTLSKNKINIKDLDSTLKLLKLNTYTEQVDKIDGIKCKK